LLFVLPEQYKSIQGPTNSVDNFFISNAGNEEKLQQNAKNNIFTQ